MDDVTVEMNTSKSKFGFVKNGQIYQFINDNRLLFEQGEKQAVIVEKFNSTHDFTISSTTLMKYCDEMGIKRPQRYKTTQNDAIQTLAQCLADHMKEHTGTIPEELLNLLSFEKIEQTEKSIPIVPSPVAIQMDKVTATEANQADLFA